MSKTGPAAALSHAPQIAPAELMTAGLAAGDVAVWRWDVLSGRLHWSDNLETIHRFSGDREATSFAAFVDEIHPEDRARFVGELQTAAASADRYLVQYRLPADGAEASERWIEARGEVMRGPEGAAHCVTGICQDISRYKAIEAELAVRARQHEAVVHLGERALAGVDLQETFLVTTKMVAELTSADLVEILELSSDRESLVLRAGFGWQDDVVGQSTATSDADTQIGIALRSPAPVVVSDFSKDDRFPLPENLAAEGIRSGASLTVAGRDNKPFGVISVYCRGTAGISPTDLRFLQSVANTLGSAIRAAHDQERNELLIGELRHRVGNLFSLVQALHRQTGQSATDAHDLELKFGSRLAALASAHALILETGWQKTSLRALMRTTLAPYIERVEFTGTDVGIPADAAFSFSMALHELATNANKYGSLAEPDGRLLIDTCSTPDALGQKVVLVWKEKDGAPPPERATEGFGSRLIGQVVERQLGGQVTRAFEPDGLKLTLEFPL